MGAQFFLDATSDLISVVPLAGDNGGYVYADITASELDYDYDYEISDANQTQPYAITTQESFAATETSTSSFIIIHPPGMTVGTNMNDVAGSTQPFVIGNGYGAIEGGNSQDKLIGDYGGSTMEEQTQNYNIVFVMDVSGSMKAESVTGESRLELMVRSVNELMTSFASFEGGEIKVHITTFSTEGGNSGTFTVTNPDEFNDAIALMNSLTHGGYTNYEAGLRDAVNWLESGDAIENATTTTYFLSDGFPNFVVNDANGESDYVSSSLEAMEEVLGNDGSDEVTALQSLSDEVIGVGISIGDSISNIELIDSDGNALNVPADQLVAVMQKTNPMTKLASVGDDEIYGDAGNDIIFGDAVNTDALAIAHGLDTVEGDGWKVFEQLEAGLSNIQSNWARGDTLAYISNNYLELSEEVVTDDGSYRIGGNDILYGGDGSDIIFGQEGDDIINGGRRSDILYGGSGADTFVYETLADRTDNIMDFNAEEGDKLDLSELLSAYDPVEDIIEEFVYLYEQNGNTHVAVDTTGSDAGVSYADTFILNGVTGLDLTELVDNGSLIVE